MNHICIGVTDNCKNPESYGTICVKCNRCGRFDKPKQTNADRIRAMSDEELAKMILQIASCDKENVMCVPTEYKHSGKCDGHCLKGRLDWLKQEADNPELGGDT